MHQAPQERQGGPRGHGPVIPGQLVPSGHLDPSAHPAPGPAYGAGPLPVVLAAEKSVGAAFVLTFFFGPLGMLYSTVSGALIMLGITVVLALGTGLVIGLITLATFGLGSFLVVLAPLVGIPIWIASMIWGCLAASHHNDRVRAQYAQLARGYRPAGC